MAYKNIEYQPPAEPACTTCRSSNGIALLMVLWVLAILSTIAISFSYMTRLEAGASYNAKELQKAAFLAEAGINKAIVELFYRKKFPHEEESWPVNGSVRQVDFGDKGVIKIKIFPERAKVDLNKANELILRGLFDAVEVDPDIQDIIIDSIQDWKDEDDLVRLNGAEDEYYMSLDNPYNTKNAPFDTIEELLLVKGITEDIFYGSQDRRGVKDFLTVYSYSDKIYINAAEREVLMALPNMTGEAVDRIVEYRENLEFGSDSELKSVIPDFYAAIKPFITTKDGGMYSIDSLGTIRGFKGTYGITAVIQAHTNDYKFHYYKTPAKLNLTE